MAHKPPKSAHLSPQNPPTLPLCDRETENPMHASQHVVVFCSSSCEFGCRASGEKKIQVRGLYGLQIIPSSQGRSSFPCKVAKFPPIIRQHQKFGRSWYKLTSVILPQKFGASTPIPCVDRSKGDLGLRNGMVRHLPPNDIFARVAAGIRTGAP